METFNKGTLSSMNDEVSFFLYLSQIFFENKKFNQVDEALSEEDSENSKDLQSNKSSHDSTPLESSSDFSSNDEMAADIEKELNSKET